MLTYTLIVTENVIQQNGEVLPTHLAVDLHFILSTRRGAGWIVRGVEDEISDLEVEASEFDDFPSKLHEAIGVYFTHFPDRRLESIKNHGRVWWTEPDRPVISLNA